MLSSFVTPLKKRNRDPLAPNSRDLKYAKVSSTKNYMLEGCFSRRLSDNKAIIARSVSLTGAPSD